MNVFVVAGIGAVLALLVFTWALCKTAADADRALEREAKERAS